MGNLGNVNYSCNGFISLFLVIVTWSTTLECKCTLFCTFWSLFCLLVCLFGFFFMQIFLGSQHHSARHQSAPNTPTNEYGDISALEKEKVTQKNNIKVIYSLSTPDLPFFGTLWNTIITPFKETDFFDQQHYCSFYNVCVLYISDWPAKKV